MDELIEKIIAAKTREEITIAAALRRVLRAGRYWIPAWYTGEHFWPIGICSNAPAPFRRSQLPTSVAMATWWRDAAKAQRIGR